ncbi:MAG: sortase [Sneathiella sp.]
MRKILGFGCIFILLVIALWQLSQAGLLAAKAWAAPVLIKYAWEQKLETGIDSLPWPWADSGPTAKISIPKLDVDRYILQGDNMRNLAFGPVLQQRGATTILYGHRDTHFSFLRKMKVDDVVIFEGGALGVGDMGSEEWLVERTRVVPVDEIYIPAGENEKSLMMITCYPFGAVSSVSDQRFVVWLKQAQSSV